MAKFEEKHVYTYPLQPKLWKMLNDDIFLIWHHDLESLHEFIGHLTMVHPIIKFASKISSQQIPFWTLWYISKRQTQYQTFPKPSDRPMYLTIIQNTHQGFYISYSQFLRLKRIHSKSQYLLEAKIHVLFVCFSFSLKRLSLQWNSSSLRTIWHRPQRRVTTPQEPFHSNRDTIYGNQHMIELTYILRKAFPNIVLTLVD